MKKLWPRLKSVSQLLRQYNILQVEDQDVPGHGFEIVKKNKEAGQVKAIPLFYGFQNFSVFLVQANQQKMTEWQSKALVASCQAM